MPSMHWMGVRWHLSTDALALAGAVLLAVNAAWLAAYAAVIAALGRPQPCEARGEHRAVVWGLLGFLALNVVAAAGMVWVGMQGALVWWHVVRAACCLVLCRRGRGCIFSANVGVPAHIPCRPPLLAGTPLQPSKRRWMGPLMYFQAAKWLSSVGYIAFCIQAVYSLPAACWQGERRGVVEAMLWSTIAIFAALGCGATPKLAAARGGASRTQACSWLPGRAAAVKRTRRARGLSLRGV